MTTLYYESSITHHGVKGQKWGVIRDRDDKKSSSSTMTKTIDIRRSRKKIKTAVEKSYVNPTRKIAEYSSSGKLDKDNTKAKSFIDKYFPGKGLRNLSKDFMDQCYAQSIKNIEKHVNNGGAGKISNSIVNQVSDIQVKSLKKLGYK